ncbi:MAG: DUF502 domain-containing protein [Pseudomonadota bacterium]
MMRLLRRFLIAGLLVWLPIGVTVFLFRVLLQLMNNSLRLLPEAINPVTYGYNIPGLGAVLTVLVLLLTGLLTANFVGRKFVAASESLLNRIPLIRTVYSASKNFAEVVFSPTGDSFKRVLLIQYPREGVWSLAFQTSNNLGEVQAKTGKDMLCTFVPTTPNPTSGFIIMVPADEAIVLDMDVESALKMIISLGVVVPEWQPGGVPPAVAATADTP